MSVKKKNLDMQKKNKEKFINKKKVKETEEQLFNRIMINFGIAIVAYSFLNILNTAYYMQPAMMFGWIFLAIAILGYVLHFTKIVKAKIINYAHMFLAFALAMFFTSLSKIVSTLIGLDGFIKLINSSDIIKKLMNSQNEVTIVSVLGAVYLVGMLIYNSILIHKAGKKNK